MATTFTLTTECAADVATMFDVSLDIDVHVRSMRRSRERAIAGVTSGRIGLGQTVTWRARHFGLWFTMTSKITELDRPSRFVDEQVRGPFRSFHHVHEFVRASNGCRMTDTITVSAPFFGILAERLVLVPYLKRLMRQRNSALLRGAF